MDLCRMVVMLRTIGKIGNELSNLNSIDAWFYRADNPDTIEFAELIKMNKEYWLSEYRQ